MTHHTLHHVTDASQVGEARRAAVYLAERLGFDAVDCGKIAIIVTEVANNLLKHAQAGALLLATWEQEEATGVELLAFDRGPGMVDLKKCLRDGFSTGGTPGTGLGAIIRLSTFTDFYSQQPSGTVMVARLLAAAVPPPTVRFNSAAICVPKSGEQVSGDSWAVCHQGARILCMVADGLGHGEFAAEASRKATRILREKAHLGPAGILEASHAALRGTRGAAVAVAEVFLDKAEIRYAGVGNISGLVLLNGESRSMVTHNGTIGHEARKFQEFTYPFPQGALLVMHSDGLTARWNLDAYPGLAVRDPALTAGVLYRDFQRGRDDATVLVARAEEWAP